MSSNRELLVRVARKVEPLLDRLVFVGGAVADIYFSDPASDRVRPTSDTDAVCDVASYTELHRIGDQLRDLGFKQSAREGDPAYRWRSGPDVLDLMVDDVRVLGFTNPWYSEALDKYDTVELEPNLEIRVAPPAVYLATKLAAHSGRGQDDPLTSRDLEDVIGLLTNRPEIVQEVQDADDELRRWIEVRIKQFIPEGLGRDVVSAFVPEVRTVPGLRSVVLDRLNALRG